MMCNFVEWPVLAHLPPGRDFPRRTLPYSYTAQNREILQSIMSEASKAQPIWLIGLEVDDPTGERFVLSRAVQIATQTHGMRAIERRQYGLVRVVLLRRQVTDPKWVN